MEILKNINNLINEIAPPIRQPIPMAKPKPLSSMVASKVMQGRRLSYNDFLAAQRNELIPGQPGLARPIQMKMFQAYNQGKR